MGRRRIHLGERTLVMGVLNVTPDSFSDGGVYFNPDRAIEHGLEMAAQGADWIDVGGESTRPGSKPIPAEEELGRVLPVIRGLSSKLRKLRRPAAISVDTTKAEVAEQAILAGAGIINQAPVNLTGLLALNKTYDTTNTAALNSSNAKIFGVITPDVGNVSLDKSGAAWLWSW